jgi:hypothetical protein
MRIRPARSTTSIRPLLSGIAERNTGWAKPLPTRRTAKLPPARLVTVICTACVALAWPSLTVSEAS